MSWRQSWNKNYVLRTFRSKIILFTRNSQGRQIWATNYSTVESLTYILAKAITIFNNCMKWFLHEEFAWLQWRLENYFFRRWWNLSFLCYSFPSSCVPIPQTMEYLTDWLRNNSVINNWIIEYVLRNKSCI